MARVGQVEQSTYHSWRLYFTSIVLGPWLTGSHYMTEKLVGALNNDMQKHLEYKLPHKITV